MNDKIVPYENTHIAPASSNQTTLPCHGLNLAKETIRAACFLALKEQFNSILEHGPGMFPFDPELVNHNPNHDLEE